MLRITISTVLLIALCACGSTTGTPSGSDPLYEDLGGMQGIEGIVDEFLYSLAGNPLALPLFANTNITRFREQFAIQLCDVAGGPCAYEGDSMAATHRGMEISHAQFNSVVSDLIDAMERSEVPTTAQNRLLARLAPMYGEIAGK